VTLDTHRYDSMTLWEAMIIGRWAAASTPVAATHSRRCAPVRLGTFPTRRRLQLRAEALLALSERRGGAHVRGAAAHRSGPVVCRGAAPLQELQGALHRPKDPLGTARQPGVL